MFNTFVNKYSSRSAKCSVQKRKKARLKGPFRVVPMLVSHTSISFFISVFVGVFLVFFDTVFKVIVNKLKGCGNKMQIRFLTPMEKG